MDKLKLISPAKINFGLNIISKRNDGYHDIETIFYPLPLSDKLTLEKSIETQFKCNLKSLTADPSNLIIKAKEILEEKFKIKLNVKIELEKNIPLGAGLGGGSSNAASMLLGLNELFDLDINETEMREIALQLGSDVPFFINPQLSYAEGRGEMLTPISFKISKPIIIINPGIHVSTSWAYSKIKPQPAEFNLKELTEKIFEDNISLNESVKNDFEKIVFEEFPEIAELKSELYYLGAYFSLMSGSGSTIFAIFNDLNTAEKVKNIFQNKYYTYLHYENI
jgi:4-diphosphocytidyl-2-C-methyl-D-erythritol kinase